MSDKENQLYSETTPIFYKVGKKVKFDESTAKTVICVYPPSSGNVQNVLNQTNDISFVVPGVMTQILYPSSEYTGIRTRLTYLTGTGAANSLSVLNTALGTPNSNADITFDSTFWGQMFDKFELLIGNQSVEFIQPFEPYFELMCHLKPLDFKLQNGTRIGYIPDEVTGIACDQRVANVNFGLTFSNSRSCCNWSVCCI